MGKRKSITGVRKKNKKTATSRALAVKFADVDAPLSVSPMSAKSPRPRELLSVQNSPPENPPSRKREAVRVGEQRKKSLSSFYSISKAPTGPGSTGAGSLMSRVKHVSQDIIRSKWEILDGEALRKVEDLLHSMELSVLAIYSSEQRKTEAQAALRSITGTLCKRLPRMPFPPEANEIHFDYERLVKHNVDLKQSVATSVTSRASLANEIKKQKFALSSERQEFEGFE